MAPKGFYKTEGFSTVGSRFKFGSRVPLESVCYRNAEKAQSIRGLHLGSGGPVANAGAGVEMVRIRVTKSDDVGIGIHLRAELLPRLY